MLFTSAVRYPTYVQQEYSKMPGIAGRYCIVGTGGFGREVLCCLQDFLATTGERAEDCAVFMVDDEYYSSPEIMRVPVIRRADFIPEDYKVLVAVSDPATRKSICASLPPETVYATLIHPTVIISEWVEIGAGSIITAGCVVTCNIKFGNHTHLNLNTTIGHDGVFGDFFTTAPGASISGGCRFAECVYFGTGSSVREGISICNHVTIGMGGVVVKDILDSGTYIGNPTRPLSH
jgi:sugar O-acyltransferase (sialic acid O-acetyltransferase NeuD family)